MSQDQIASLNEHSMVELASRLSPEAQRLLFEEQDPLDGLPQPVPKALAAGPFIAVGGLQTWLKILHGKLESIIVHDDLVDDAQQIGNWLFHKFEQPVIFLRTPEGRSIQSPGEEDLRRALDNLFAKPALPAAAWLADARERWLDLTSDGKAYFFDQGPEAAYSLERVGKQKALRLFKMFNQGDLAGLRRAFRSSRPLQVSPPPA